MGLPIEVLRSIYLPYEADTYTCILCGRLNKKKSLIRKLHCEKGCVVPEFVEMEMGFAEHLDFTKLGQAHGYIYIRYNRGDRAYFVKERGSAAVLSICRYRDDTVE